MKQDLIVQSKIGNEENLEKFLATIGQKAPIGAPCAARLKGLDRQAFEQHWREKAHALQIDANWVDPALKLTDVKLFASDMDSTLLDLETLDEMAAYIGKGEEVARITELAMHGKLANYADSLTERIKLMAGAPASIIDRLLAEKIKPNPGAEVLLKTLKAAGIPTLLVTGGFTCICEPVKERFGFDRLACNEIEIVDGKLTGRVWGPNRGPIMAGPGKIEQIRAYAQELGVDVRNVIAMGDGSNDIPMLEGAGFSVAWHAKPMVRSHAWQALDYAPLSGVLAFFN